jgi:copper(I)-binding protein
MTRLAVALFIAILAWLAPAAAADVVKAGALELSSLWTRATPPKAPSAAGYLTIVNTGNEADRLVGVASPMAGKADLHSMEMKKGVMTMRRVAAIDIPAGGTVALDPDGLHIMFTELKGDLKAGGTMPVTLAFEKAGKVEVSLQVLSVGAKGPKAAMGGMDMSGTKDQRGGMKMDMGQ